MSYRELLLGCGSSRERRIDPYRHLRTPRDSTVVPQAGHLWQNLVTLDMNPSCDPDIVMDLGPMWVTDAAGVRRNGDVLEPYGDRLGFRANMFDEVHAYEVLEHLGALGDYEALFSDFDEIWRMLKPGGFLCATVPSRYSMWLWGDPGHRRTIYPCTLVFLHRPHYDQAVGRTTSSDYRSVFAGDFDILYSYDNEEQHSFVLQAVKPAREVPT